MIINTKYLLLSMCPIKTHMYDAEIVYYYFFIFSLLSPNFNSFTIHDCFHMMGIFINFLPVILRVIFKDIFFNNYALMRKLTYIYPWQGLKIENRLILTLINYYFNNIYKNFHIAYLGYSRKTKISQKKVLSESAFRIFLDKKHLEIKDIIHAYFKNTNNEEDLSEADIETMEFVKH